MSWKLCWSLPSRKCLLSSHTLLRRNARNPMETGKNQDQGFCSSLLGSRTKSPSGSCRKVSARSLGIEKLCSDLCRWADSLLHSCRGQGWCFLIWETCTEFEEPNWSFGVEETGPSSFVLRDAVSSGGGKWLWIFISACSRVVVLHFDGSGAVENWQFFPHGVGGSLVGFEVVVLGGSWDFEGIEWDVASLR